MPRSCGETRRSFLVFLLPILAAATPAAALDPLPEKPGWHGFDMLGAGIQSLGSSFISGSVFQKFGAEEIDSLGDRPDAMWNVVPLIRGEVGYRFAGSRTYLSAGHTLDDLLRYDFTASIRLIQGLGRDGLLGVELLAGLPVRVWEDPYVTGARRDRTDRELRGARLTWSRIGPGFEIELTTGKTEIGTEHSGKFLGLTDAERTLLERDGLVHQIRVSYRIKLSKRHVLLPRASFQVQDRDGEAVAHDLTGFELDYFFEGEKTTITATVYAESARYHEENPVYGEVADAEGLGTSFILLFPSWLPGKWSAGFRGAAYRDDSDIDFFDARFASFALVSARRW